MSYHITITAETGPELAEQILSMAAMLTGVSGVANGDARQPANDVAEAEPVDEPREPRKGRAKKPDKAPEVVDVKAEASEPEAESDAEEEVGNTNPKTGNPWTKDEVRTIAVDYINAYAEKHPDEEDARRNELFRALEVLGCTKLSDIPVEKYGAFIAEVRKREAAL